MEQQKNTTDKKDEPKSVAFAEFLKNTPPIKLKKVSGLAKYGIGTGLNVNTPSLLLYCSGRICNGIHLFDYFGSEGNIYDNTASHTFLLKYQCRHCKLNKKFYSIFAYNANTGILVGEDYDVLKMGEYPAFGPHIPKKVTKLIETDKEFFEKGLEAENHGLGIGAFSYYRRVVENQKNHLLGQIIKVSEKLNVKPDIIEKLKDAQSERQFKNSVDKMKHAIPQALLIDGHNPMTLLHNALSAGLHAETDDDCLKLATSIRVVLTDLAERIDQALKDHAEVKSAISHLFKISNPQNKKQP